MVPVNTYVPPLEIAAPPVDAADGPFDGPVDGPVDGPGDSAGEGPKVGLFFGDGTHVFMDAADPRALAFKQIADELNR